MESGINQQLLEGDMKSYYNPSKGVIHLLKIGSLKSKKLSIAWIGRKAG